MKIVLPFFGYQKDNRGCPVAEWVLFNISLLEGELDFIGSCRKLLRQAIWYSGFWSFMGFSMICSWCRAWKALSNITQRLLTLLPCQPFNPRPFLYGSRWYLSQPGQCCSRTNSHWIMAQYLACACSSPLIECPSSWSWLAFFHPQYGMMLIQARKTFFSQLP